MTQAIRNFAKSLEGWLSNAMNAIPQRMIQTKVDCSSTSHLHTYYSHALYLQQVIFRPLCVFFSQIAAVSAFAQTLRRYTSLNHLAQAARAVLQNTSQINQMLSDLNRVDFANVQVRTALCVWIFSSSPSVLCTIQFLLYVFFHCTSINLQCFLCVAV